VEARDAQGLCSQRVHSGWVARKTMKIPRSLSKEVAPCRGYRGNHETEAAGEILRPFVWPGRWAQRSLQSFVGGVRFVDGSPENCSPFRSAVF
jgi:hypothetical protein